MTEYTIKARFLYEYAKNLNHSGVHFPIIGICLGLQMMHLWEAPYRDTLQLKAYDDLNHPSNVTFVGTTEETELYKNFPESLIKKMTTDDLVFEGHTDGI